MSDDTVPRPSGIGASRRLQALVAIGYPPAGLARALGLTEERVEGILSSVPANASGEERRRIIALFDRQWIHPQQGAAASCARASAAACGWVGPLAWDDIDDPSELPNTTGTPQDSADDPDDEPWDSEPIDEIAVELAIAGSRVRLTRPERLYALALLHAEKWSDASIAKVLDVDTRTVMRNRKAMGLAAFDQNELKRADNT